MQEEKNDNNKIQKDKWYLLKGNMAASAWESFVKSAEGDVQDNQFRSSSANIRLTRQSLHVAKQNLIVDAVNNFYKSCYNFESSMLYVY